MFAEPADRVEWSESDVRAFLGGYGIVPERLAVERLDSWWWNLVLRVEADERTLILRRYGLTPLEEVLWEVELLRHLRAHDFPCVAPLARSDGSVTGPFAGKTAIVYPYIDGDDCWRAGLDRRYALGETVRVIARLHELTHDLKLSQPRVQSGTESRRHIERFLSFVRTRGIGPDEPALARLAEQAARGRDEFAARLAHVVPDEDDLPRGVVHHDSHAGNVLFRGDRLVALIDFDDAFEGHTVADVAHMIDNWATDWDTNSFMPDTAAHVVATYDRAHPLTAAERGLLPDFLAFYQLADACEQVHENLTRDGTNPSGSAAERMVTGCNMYWRYLRNTSTADWRSRLRETLFQAGEAPLSRPVS